MTALILAGGRGQRLLPLTEELPKPMIDVAGKPVIEHQIDNLRRYGVTDVLLVVGHRAEAIRSHFGDGAGFGVRIGYFEETEPLGTAGALPRLHDRLPERFLLLYGDVMTDVDFARMLEFHEQADAECTILVHPNDHPADSDLVVLDQDQVVTGLIAKNARRDRWHRNLTNAGVMVLDRAVVRRLRGDGPKDLEKDLLTEAVRARRVRGYRSSEYVKDMGTPHRLAAVRRAVASGTVRRRNLSNSQKAVFLDRDGTINDHVGLLTRPEQISVQAEVITALRLLNESDFLAIVVTNQPVVARGLCDLAELDTIHGRLDTVLGEHGVYLDDLYFCPHHPDGGFPGERRELKRVCACRKPGTGLVDAAAGKYAVDIRSSYLVGDTTVDVQTARNSGLRSVLLGTGMAGRDGKYAAAPDKRAADLLGAVRWILAEDAARTGAGNAAPHGSHRMQPAPAS